MPAATKLLELQSEVHGQLSKSAKTVEEIARSLDADPEDVFHALRHLASNDAAITTSSGEHAGDDKFSLAK